jgi:Ca2+-binding EF-hand superfamily protein
MTNKNYKVRKDVLPDCRAGLPPLCLDTIVVFQEPNSIAQEIYDELDATEDGEVTPKEYCQVARKHTARLTDEQCKEIIKLMDEGA